MTSPTHLLLTGIVREMLPTLADCSVDSIVTDPPYEIGFMGKGWDSSGIAYSVDMWRECLRVLKPGGHLLSFSGARTYHRMVCAIEDAGFEIRDQIMWVYGSGFPKSLDVSKAFDKAAGAAREVVGPSPFADKGRRTDNAVYGESTPSHTEVITAPATEDAKKWDGWGTALKPAHEPIVLARKPLIGTVVKNVDKYGTGALNIAGCRVEGEPVPINKLESWSGFGQEVRPDYEQTINTQGRWPANLIHDGSDEVLAAFPNAPGQCADVKYDETECQNQNIYGAMKRGHEPTAEKTYTNVGGTNFAMKPGARRLDSGTAARFFYCAKASKADRNEGCEDLEAKQYSHDGRDTPIDNAYQRNSSNSSNSSNSHLTVKPTDLMRYLCRLITPPGGLVLDPFMGSGSTGKAAVLEGFNFIGIDMTPEYVQIAEKRIAAALKSLPAAETTSLFDHFFDTPQGEPCPPTCI